MIKELIEFVVKQIVTHPQDVVITVEESAEKNMVEIKVNDQDRGKVIGREGQIIKAMRMLAQASSSDNKKISIDIVK